MQFELPSSGRRVPWSFQVEGRQVEIQTSGSLTCLEDFLSTVIAVKNGAGLMQAYRFSVQQELQSGELVEVLAKFGGTSRPFILLYPQVRHMPQWVRVFVDFLLRHHQDLARAR